MRFRRLNKARALSGGYFWLPCHLCGQEFGGHEWRDVKGHESSVPYENTPYKPDFGKGVHSHGICSDCTATGKGCEAWARIGVLYHCQLPEALK